MIKERIRLLQNELNGGEAALITSEPGRFYYTGFPSSAGCVAVTRKRAVFFIDFRYYEKAAKTVTDCETVLQKSLYSQLSCLFAEEKISTVYLETASVTLDFFGALSRKLGGISVSSDSRIQRFILKQRSIKSAEEAGKIKEAQKMTDETFSYILDRIAAGRTEREVMLDMEFFMRRLGSEGTAFDFIVVSGRNSSLPHGVPSDKKIQKGDFVTMDFGAVCGGYRSDMTRTVAVGGVSEKQRNVYETVLAAQKKTIEFIKPGVICKDVDRVARDIIAGAGYDGCFGHGLGHSVGLEIHEEPACNTVCETVMSKGMVMTVEPGIYIENEFGVRIEDMVIVTENGCEDITAGRKDLIIL